MTKWHKKLLDKGFYFANFKSIACYSNVCGVEFIYLAETKFSYEYILDIAPKIQ